MTSFSPLELPGRKADRIPVVLVVLVLGVVFLTWFCLVTHVAQKTPTQRGKRVSLFFRLASLTLCALSIGIKITRRTCLSTLQRSRSCAPQPHHPPPHARFMGVCTRGGSILKSRRTKTNSPEGAVREGTALQRPRRAEDHVNPMSYSGREPTPNTPKGRGARGPCELRTRFLSSCWRP